MVASVAVPPASVSCDPVAVSDRCAVAARVAVPPLKTSEPPVAVSETWAVAAVVAVPPARVSCEPVAVSERCAVAARVAVPPVSSSAAPVATSANAVVSVAVPPVSSSEPPVASQVNRRDRARRQPADRIGNFPLADLPVTGRRPATLSHAATPPGRAAPSRPTGCRASWWCPDSPSLRLRAAPPRSPSDRPTPCTSG